MPYSTSLRVAALPLDIVWADKDANLAALHSALKSLPAGTDLLVLPELFSTGYVNDVQLLGDLAETNGGPTVKRLAEIAREHNCAVAGSFLARTASGVYNRGFFIEPSGDETFYDKRHLFSLSDESKILNPGLHRMPVVRFRGWNIALIVCYDLRFPVWCRSIDEAYDALIVPANWPRARGYAWTHLLIARAIENQAAVIGANRGGSDNYGTYDGLTQIFDSMGKPVGAAEGPFVAADLSLNQIKEWRKRFPVSRDADSINICL